MQRLKLDEEEIKGEENLTEKKGKSQTKNTILIGMILLHVH